MNYSFARECLYLPSTPLNATEAYNKLKCLQQLQRVDTFRPLKASKRQTRIARMYWAFKKMEVKK